MEYDSALNLQAEIFQSAFEYEEMPAAFSDDAPVPLFLEPSTDFEFLAQPAHSVGTHSAPTHGAGNMRSGSTAGGFIERPKPTRKRFEDARQIALGIATKFGSEDQHEIAVLYQDRKLKSAAIMDSIFKAAHGECRFSWIGTPRSLTADPWHMRHVVDPLRLGSSVAHHRVTAGTLGCFVRHRGHGRRGILSNNHVLADVNSGANGDDIWQPAKRDGGKATHSFATLEEFVPLTFSGSPNLYDCAWASLADGVRGTDVIRLFDSADLPVGQLSASTPVDAWPQVTVVKVGRTTGYTQGIVDAVNVNNLEINYKRGRKVRFDGQIQIESMSRTPFARPGDSGSLICNSQFEPLGLLFSGSATGGFQNMGYTWANPIGSILNVLELDILT